LNYQKPIKVEAFITDPEEEEDIREPLSQMDHHQIK
jgi:hypothetical protein